MATRQIYNNLDHEPEIGQISFGWKCVEYYPHHNLWQRVSQNQANGIKSCFPKKSIPNQYAWYFWE